MSSLHSKVSSTEHPPALPFLSQTHHGASFSTGARFPFFLAFPAADASSPLLGSFAPRPLLKRAPRSTSAYALFILPDLSHTSSLRSFFLHIPSFSPRAPRAHTQRSPSLHIAGPRPKEPAQATLLALQLSTHRTPRPKTPIRLLCFFLPFPPSSITLSTFFHCSVLL